MTHLRADSISTSPEPSLSPQLARALIRSLTRGTAIAQGVRYIHVGHSSWLAAQQELLAEIAEDGHSETKFVRGAYGAGKSHFLSVVQDRARANGWWTSHVECKVDQVEIDRFETLYPKIISKLLSSELLEANEARSGTQLEPVRYLLERWTTLQLKAAGVREGGIVRPFDVDDRLYQQLQRGLLTSNLSPDFARAVAAFARAFLAKDFETTSAVCAWMRGLDEKMRLPSGYLKRATLGSSVTGSVEIRPIGKGTAHEVMRGMLWLIQSAGFAGLVLCIDEVEELAKLSTRKRQDQALQALREYVDHAGGDGGYLNLCMYLAATPEMFEGPNYFPRYDALATRIQPVNQELNWRAPVIDLDRTPLDAMEMRELAARLVAVHKVAYESSVPASIMSELLDRIVNELGKSQLRIAKPRLLARVVIHELERARQAPTGYELPSDISAVIVHTASLIAKEAN